jgi:hypothetical protein
MIPMNKNGIDQTPIRSSRASDLGMSAPAGATAVSARRPPTELWLIEILAFLVSPDGRTRGREAANAANNRLQRPGVIASCPSAREAWA